MCRYFLHRYILDPHRGEESAGPVHTEEVRAEGRRPGEGERGEEVGERGHRHRLQPPQLRQDWRSPQGPLRENPLPARRLREGGGQQGQGGQGDEGEGRNFLVHRLSSHSSFSLSSIGHIPCSVIPLSHSSVLNIYVGRYSILIFFISLLNV